MQYYFDSVAFLFVIETAMRTGEICSLMPQHVSGQVATQPQTKNGTKRVVLPSKRVIELMKLLPDPTKGEPIFEVAPRSMGAIFRKVKTRAGIEGVTFHDMRRLAITRLARKLNLLDLAGMVGHRDLQQLQVYHSECASDTARRLN